VSQFCLLKSLASLPKLTSCSILVSYGITRLTLIPFIITQESDYHICVITPKELVHIMELLEITYKAQFYLLRNRCGTKRSCNIFTSYPPNVELTFLGCHISGPRCLFHIWNYKIHHFDLVHLAKMWPIQYAMHVLGHSCFIAMYKKVTC
jgi:hypothetical protein